MMDKIYKIFLAIGIIFIVFILIYSLIWYNPKKEKQIAIGKRENKKESITKDWRKSKKDIVVGKGKEQDKPKRKDIKKPVNQIDNRLKKMLGKEKLAKINKLIGNLKKIDFPKMSWERVEFSEEDLLKLLKLERMIWNEEKNTSPEQNLIIEKLLYEIRNNPDEKTRAFLALVVAANKTKDVKDTLIKVLKKDESIKVKISAMYALAMPPVDKKSTKDEHLERWRIRLSAVSVASVKEDEIPEEPEETKGGILSRIRPLRIRHPHYLERPEKHLKPVREQDDEEVKNAFIEFIGSDYDKEFREKAFFLLFGSSWGPPISKTITPLTDDIINLIRNEKDRGIKSDLIRVLEYSDDKKAEEEMFRIATTETDPFIKGIAIENLYNFRIDKETLQLLIDIYYNDTNTLVRKSVVETVRWWHRENIDKEKILDFLSDCAQNDPSKEVREEARLRIKKLKSKTKK